MRDVLTFENQCKYHANQIWNFDLQKATFTATNFTHKWINSSYCLQNKYVCIEIFLEVYFLEHIILNWQKTQ